MTDGPTMSAADDPVARDLGLGARDSEWLHAVSRHRRLTGLPTDAQARDRRRALQLLVDAAPHLADRVESSGLGPVWWNDIDIVAPDRDAHRGGPSDKMGHTIGDRTMLRDLTPLFARIGSRTGGAPEYAVVDPVDGCVVGRIDPARAPARTALERVTQRVRRRCGPDVRDVLELRAIESTGVSDRSDPVLSEIARLERLLSAGTPATTVLDAYRRAGLAADARRTGWAMWRGQRRLRQWLRRPYVVALSGVDGSGKSTSSRLLIRYLDRVGVDSARVWSRPGNRMEWAERLLTWTGLRSGGTRPTVATVAEGGSSADAASRRGVVGWVWVLLVTTTFLVDVWAQYLRHRSRRIIVFDRHLVDALVTLEFVYAGVDLTLSSWLCRLLPRADVTLYLSVDAEQAAARKPGDTFGLYAVSRQLELYGRELSKRPRIITVGTAATPERQALILFDHLVGPQDSAARRAP